MQALIVYDTRFGNTEQVARAVAATLGANFTTRVVSAAEVDQHDLAGADLLVIGGPTHAHGLSIPMKDLLTGLQRASLENVAAVTFDTRFHTPRWLTGSAARVIARRLCRAGCRLVTEPESFFVAGTQGNPLLPGELERAGVWATSLLAALPQPTPRR